MPLMVAAEDAKAWSSWLRLARLQTGIATSQGLVSSALREPDTVSRVVRLLVREIAGLPRTGRVMLTSPDDPDFLVFAHYQRASTVWLDELAQRGIISAWREGRARSFEQALLDHAGLTRAEPVGPAPSRVRLRVPVARRPAAGLTADSEPKVILDLSWQSPSG